MSRSALLMRPLRWRPALEVINRRCGELVSWLTLAMVLVMVAVVVLRYGFDIGSIALQESITYMYALVFMLGAGYTLLKDEHVRVDIFYSKWSPRRRAWVDLLGTLVFLYPLCIFIMVMSWSYVERSWMTFEGSPDAGGLPFIYLLKTVVLIMPVLLMLQGLVMILRNLAILTGQEQPQTPRGPTP